MEIIVAKTAGFCFGVKRAMEMVTASLKDSTDSIYSLGPLIHNPEVVQQLEREGLQVVSNINEVPSGRVVIRSHGVGPSVYEYAAVNGLKVIDATCPFVKNVHQLALMLEHDGYQVIILGESDHAEVKGVMETLSGRALIVEDVSELEHFEPKSKVGIISQTTQDVAKLQELVSWITPHCKECRVFNTICSATASRQQETAELSRQVDLMIVVGGKNSANTKRLAEISSQFGTPTYHVETADELQIEWFQNINRIGITAGASTPDEHIKKVVEKIKISGGNASV